MPGRKPIHLELKGGKSQRQRIWELIRKHAEQEFTQQDVTPGGIPNDTARDFLRALAKAGFLQQVQAGTAQRIKGRWKLLNDAGAEAPRVNKQGKIVTQGNGNEAIWGAMQAIGTFTPRLLTEISGAKPATVKSYCELLFKAGYLTLERPSKTCAHGGIQAQYRLLRSKIKGPRPPMITRLKAVYDPNIHEFVWQQNADDVLEEAEGGAQ